MQHDDLEIVQSMEYHSIEFIKHLTNYGLIVDNEAKAVTRKRY